MMIKKTVKKFLEYIIIIFSKTNIGIYSYSKITEIVMNNTRVIRYKDHALIFSVPNWLNKYRVDTFASKEPETLDWIESIKEKSIIWDVGANIGLYSIYAAKAMDCKVFAFEPSVFNLELLARNIFYNNLQKKIIIVPVALNDEKGLSLFKMTSTTWGGALSTFGENYDQNGEPLNGVFEYSTVGVSMSDAVSILDIPQPHYIKIDVDGIEHLILSGGHDVLCKVDSVMIEINDEFDSQLEESTKYLENAGLTLYKKCDLGVANQFNQWWIRE